MNPIRLTNEFVPTSLKVGTYVAASDSDAYGSLLASISSGHAEFLGENMSEHGVKNVAARVGRGQNPAIGISREFFTTVLKDYADWREKWWREAIQNSVDAGATQIQCFVSIDSEGNRIVATEDNGGGMTEEILIDKFLMLGGSTKKLGSGSAGGFGKAKELLILPWIRWSVHTRDRRVDGAGLDYEIHEAPYISGTRIEVVMPGDEATSDAAAVSFISKCSLPNVRFSVTRIDADGASSRVNPKANLTGGALVDEVLDKAEIHVIDVDYESSRLYIRVNGLYMFNQWMTSMKGKQMVVEITAPSIEVLTANRDGFRDYGIRSKIDSITELFAKNTVSALSRSKGLIRKKYSGKGKFQAERARTEVLSQIGYIEPTVNGFTEISESDITSISKVMEMISRRASGLEERSSGYSGRSSGEGLLSTSNVPDGALTRELLSSVAFLGAHHVEEAVKQLAWSPDFYVVNEIDHFKIPAKFMPETMKPQVIKLARTWTELCRYVLMQLGNFQPFGVGWTFSDSARAAFLDEDGEKWLLLNPFKKIGRTDTWTPTNIEDLKFLYAAAIHECTHLADDVGDHDESFAIALTNNIAKTADGFRKIRKIVGTIRMKDAAVADINPSDADVQIVARSITSRATIIAARLARGEN